MPYPLADLIDTLIGLVPVVVGLILGFLLTVTVSWYSNRGARIGLAAALACEVEAIRATTASSVKVLRPKVESTRAQLENGGPNLPYVGIDDGDYQTKVFDSNLSALRILGNELMLRVTELYRWVEYAHHEKSLSSEAGANFNATARRLSGQPTAMELSFFRTAGV